MNELSAPSRASDIFEGESVSAFPVLSGQVDNWRTGGVEVTQQFWRWPLAAVLGAFGDAGFKVDRVAEPQPSAEAVRLFAAIRRGL